MKTEKKEQIEQTNKAYENINRENIRMECEKHEATSKEIERKNKNRNATAGETIESTLYV